MSEYNQDDPPPMVRWAWNEWNRMRDAPRSMAPTLEDYRRAGLVRGNDFDPSFGATPKVDDEPLLHPTIAAIGGMGLLWWLSRRFGSK